MQSSRLVAALLATVVGCRSGSVPRPAPRPVPPTASTAGGAAPGLPPVPRTVGAPLAIRVQYPGENQLITSRDSNFVLGSIGSGDAQLVINGERVTPAPNGAFLAWLPNPSSVTPQYSVVVTRGADTVRRVIRVRYPNRVLLSSSGPMVVDTTSVQPLPGVRALADEWIRVSVRAAANAQVQLELADGSQRPLLVQSRVQQGD